MSSYCGSRRPDRRSAAACVRLRNQARVYDIRADKNEGGYQSAPALSVHTPRRSGQPRLRQVRRAPRGSRVVTTMGHNRYSKSDTLVISNLSCSPCAPPLIVLAKVRAVVREQSTCFAALDSLLHRTRLIALPTGREFSRVAARTQYLGQKSGRPPVGFASQCPISACAVPRRRFPVGASPTRQPLQPEAIGAVMEVTKWLKPSISVSRIGDSASVQAATRGNVEQASKRTMCRPTRLQYRGRLKWLGELSEHDALLLHRGIGGGMCTRQARETREAPRRE